MWRESIQQGLCTLGYEEFSVGDRPEGKEGGHVRKAYLPLGLEGWKGKLGKTHTGHEEKVVMTKHPNPSSSAATVA